MFSDPNVEANPQLQEHTIEMCWRNKQQGQPPENASVVKPCTTKAHYDALTDSDKKTHAQVERGFALTSFINQSAKEHKSPCASRRLLTSAQSHPQQQIVFKFQLHTPNIDCILAEASADICERRITLARRRLGETTSQRQQELRKNMETGTKRGFSILRESIEVQARLIQAKRLVNFDHPLRSRTCTLEAEKEMMRLRMDQLTHSEGELVEDPSILLHDQGTGRTSRHPADFFWSSVLGADDLLTILRQLQQSLGNPPLHYQQSGNDFQDRFVSAVLRFLEENHERYFIEAKKEEIQLLSLQGAKLSNKLSQRGKSFCSSDDDHPPARAQRRTVGLTSLCKSFNYCTSTDPESIGNPVLKPNEYVQKLPTLPPVSKPLLIVPAFLLDPPRVRAGLPAQLTVKLDRPGGLQEHIETRLDKTDATETLAEFYRKLQLHNPGVGLKAKPLRLCVEQRPPVAPRTALLVASRGRLAVSTATRGGRGIPRGRGGKAPLRRRRGRSTSSDTSSSEEDSSSDDTSSEEESSDSGDSRESSSDDS